MNTLAAVGIAAAAGVALFLIERKTATPVAPAVPQSVPTGGGGLQRTLESGANAIGTAVGGAVGAGPAAGIVGKASGGFISAEYSAWKQAGSGVTQIASGNVWGGTQNIVVGGVKTAIAPVTGAYNTIKNLL